MTVDELIRLLRDYPPDLRVMVNGYEHGYDDLEAVTASLRVRMCLKVNSAWYYGRHERAPTSDEQTSHETVRALFLRRPWHAEGAAHNE